MTTTTDTTPSSATSAQSRYNSAVATIQIREIPEDTYEALRRLARADGKSLQSYMRDQMIEMARQANKAAAFAELERVLAMRPSAPISNQRIVDLIHEGRGE